MKNDTINPQLEFHKNSTGEATEGFLSEEKFNGILFFLKEPNSGGEPADVFWLKKVIYNEGNYLSSLTNKKDKIAATKYPNLLKKCLKQIEINEEELKYCAYMNLHPNFGEKNISDDYKDMLSNFNKNSGQWQLIEKLRPRVIFTSIDIYKKIQAILNINPNDQIDGIKYKGEILPCFEGIIGNKLCKVYAIYHPRASKSIIY